MNKRQVWKYGIRAGSSQEILMPEGAEILCVQMQGDSPFLWAFVDPEAEKFPRRIAVHGTGHDIDDDVTGEYIGTFQLGVGSLVFHVFEAL